jgi:single-strand DNA-binding protein
MLDTQVTVVGNVVNDPRLTFTKDGHAFTTFRIASTPRRFDRGSGEWRDGDTLFLGVTCWRGLAENTATCLKKGQTVIVVGRLSTRKYETREGEKRESTDVDAAAIGPDLSRAVAFVKRADRSIPAPDQAAADAEADALADVADEMAAEEDDNLDWNYAGVPARDDSAELEPAVAEVQPAVMVEAEPYVLVEAEPAVLVGAGGRFKGRSGGR